jgi:hypothetical protein
LNIRSIVDMLHTGAAWAQDLPPVVKALGGPALAAAVKITETVTSIATNVLDRVEEGKIVASSDEAAEIKTIIVKLAAINDALASEIAKS